MELGHVVVIPEIADYELRRELIRASKKEGLERLDSLVDPLVYVPLTTQTMRRAAQLWARARNEGRSDRADGSTRRRCHFGGPSAVSSYRR